MVNNKQQILIIAGEVSGDFLAANLVRDVNAKNSSIKFYGVGGEAMQEAGVELIINSSELAVVGIWDVLLNLFKIKRALDIVKKSLHNNPPDLVILVDYSGFNLRVAQEAHKLGIKVFYYSSPQLWASRTWRIKVIKKCVTKMAVILPFEEKFYQKLGFDKVCYVGHPLVKLVKPTMSIETAKQRFGLLESNRIIGLFPGSRKAEIKKLLPVLIESAQLIKTKFPNSQFILPLARSFTQQDIAPFIPENMNITVIEQQHYDVIQVCDVIIAASGTVTLEIALLETPMVIVYKIFPSYFPFIKLLKVPYIGLCNLVVGEKIVQEFLQREANAKNISAEIEYLLNDKVYRDQMIANLKTVRKKLTVPHVNLVDEIFKLVT